DGFDVVRMYCYVVDLSVNGPGATDVVFDPYAYRNAYCPGRNGVGFAILIHLYREIGKVTLLIVQVHIGVMEYGRDSCHDVWRIAVSLSARNKFKKIEFRRYRKLFDVVTEL